MLLNSTYYLLKPLLPRSLCVALRQWRANRRRVRYAATWPIDERAGVVPQNWPGWPGGKRFAFVLSHDVEGQKGYMRVEQLMQFEMANGFRSSFNFVPEGEYRLSAELRQAMDRAGFEIGIHGLEHDGKLYQSKEKFAAKARRIREYAEAWGASGFRSPLMQHKLSWLHELGMEYDSSTFDSDPFEPEPDGARTIFPFWVPNRNGGGYVELPYTVVQDFTLFAVLKERTIDIWKKKIDWIAKHGGMVLLNTHPDYMSFTNDESNPHEFPIALYRELLIYVRDKYEGQYWAAQPREVARYYVANVGPASRNSRKKVCMLAYTTYECDNRVRRYAEALADRGDQVDVIALSGNAASPERASIGGVRVHRIQHRDFDEQNKWTYAWRLLRFLWTSSLFLAKRHRQIRYDVIHVHNVPDFLAFAAWYPKWTGAKIILDIHDIVPELFVSKFNTKTKGLYVRLLKLIEKASTTFADYVLVSNHLWYKKLISRSVPEHKCSVFLNHVDQAIFFRRHKTRDDGKTVILFPGSFQWHQGLDIAIEAFARLQEAIPNAELHLYGGGGVKRDLLLLAERLGMTDKVRFFDGIALDEMADVIANADLGVVPKRADSFGDQAYSTKIMEFMSQGVPVVASRTTIDTYYFDDRVVCFFPSGDVGAMASAMQKVIQDKAYRRSLIAGGYDYAERHGWNAKKSEYLGLIDWLSVETFGLSDQSAPRPAKAAQAMSGASGGGSD
jgi:glycosyltransferase involved in cell wall biosynthesis